MITILTVSATILISSWLGERAERRRWRRRLWHRALGLRAYSNIEAHMGRMTGYQQDYIREFANQLEEM